MSDLTRLFAQHQPDDYGGDSIQCQGCHPRQWFAGWDEFAAHLASLADERLAQVWDACANEGFERGWIHSFGQRDLIERNPYRVAGGAT